MLKIVVLKILMWKILVLKINPQQYWFQIEILIENENFLIEFPAEKHKV